MQALAVAQGIIAGLFGLVVGSFLGVVIDRLPSGGSLIRPARSECPHCRHTLSGGDLIPVVSYLLLQGKCRYCGGAIPRRYPLIEGLTAALFVCCFIRFGWTPALAASAILCAALVVCVFVDIGHMIVLDEVLLAAGGAGLLLNGLFSALCDWRAMLLGVVAGVAPIALIALVARLLLRQKAMGGGDIKFMAMAGAFLGWQNVLVAYLFGSVGGGIVVACLLAMKRVGPRQQIPMIPALAGGVLAALFFASPLLEWYFGLFRL